MKIIQKIFYFSFRFSLIFQDRNSSASFLCYTQKHKYIQIMVFRHIWSLKIYGSFN
jgi:hypothetical protein